MVRLIVYNIEYCEGITGHWYQYLKFWKTFFPPKGQDQKIVNALTGFKPDILALVEVDTGSFRSKKDYVVFFQEKLGMKSSVKRVKYPAKGISKMLHYIPILNKQANAIIAKYDITNIRYHILKRGVKRIVIEAVINCPKKVTLLLAHLALTKNARTKQIQELINIVNSIKDPVILMGDLNTYHGEEEIKELLEKTRLKQRYCKGLTQPSYKPKRRLDYILTSTKIKVKDYKVLNLHYSDHLPIMLDFEVK